jgi:hypothetical protein
MRTALALLFAAFAILLVRQASAPVAAHHAFGAEFDPNKPVRLQGKIVKLEWVNPHAWITLK